ncbi:MAG: hypothetical protein JOY78_12765 [Pseudonocardia sp.]|nr:hypothetical protein [Pseudonocardia sp.]
MSSDAPNKGGRPAADIELMARKLNAIIDRAMLDPSIRPYKAEICRRSGVPERTVDAKKDHPLIAAVLTRLRDLKDGRQGVAAAVAAVVGRGAAPEAAGRAAEVANDADMRDPAARAAALDEIQMATQFGQECLRAVEACMRFAGKHRRVRHVSDLPVAVRNLEATVRELTAALETLRPLATARVRREELELRALGGQEQGQLL